VSHKRCVASSRTRATSRASVVTPDSSTFSARSHATAPSKIAFGPSAVDHTRASTHASTSACTSAKSRSPNVSLIFPHVLEVGLAALGVPLHARGVLDLQLFGEKVDHFPRHHPGSSRNFPKYRAVTSWRLKPSRL
jgi:hypothetical protein